MTMLPHVRIDERRFTRTGVAEAIYAPGKTPDEIVAAAVALLSSRREHGEEFEWPVLATRVEEDITPRLERLLAERVPGARVVYEAAARVVEFDPPSRRRALGRAVVVSAGTTDRGPAAEASVVLAAYGADVARLEDVGVSGIHRLLDPDRLAALERADVVIAVAGMEGALPTVVAGLVRAPVIAVPTPVGYGVAEGGRAALHAMLASCAPGLAVVNVGNGFGAATTAVKILSVLRGARGVP